MITNGRFGGRWVLAMGMALSSSSAVAASPGLDYAESSRFIKLPLALSRDGKLNYKTENWKSETDPDGTDLLTAKKLRARAAVLKNKSGKVEALVSYVMKPETMNTKSDLEEGQALYFDGDGHLAAVTVCDEVKAARDLGRVCVTATPKLCGDLRSGKGVDPETLQRAESFETRTLASLLTLRGSDHQLDNLLKTGNRLGLKSSLQTTRGQLITLARQVAKELGRPAPEAAEANEADKADAVKIAARAKDDEKNARAVLEHTLPVLKSSCTDARF